jgi:hypothetical protein
MMGFLAMTGFIFPLAPSAEIISLGKRFYAIFGQMY